MGYGPLLPPRSRSSPPPPLSSSPHIEPAATATRTVFHAEALAWLEANPARPGMSVVTSLPDVAEVALPFEEWRAWFVKAAAKVLAWTPDDGAAVFFQSDIRHAGAWVDKGYLVMRAAEEAGSRLARHTIVCRHPPGTLTAGRASYSHLLFFARNPQPRGARPAADVLPDGGFMPSVRSMGVGACREACRYLQTSTTTDTVVDPFCGQGTALAVANAFGFHAIGVDLRAKRCKAARELVIDDGPPLSSRT